MIPFHRAVLGGNELSYLAEVAETGLLAAGGAFSARARQLLEDELGASTLLTPSCTHALELSAVLLDLRPGDEVIVPAYTFITTASAFALHGARPIFVDVDPVTLCLDPDQATEAVTTRTRAVCIVHYGGIPATPTHFVEMTDRMDLVLIEDNAHGFGGRHRGQALGTFGSLGALSFDSQKNITSGEGGALVVNDSALLSRAEAVADRGTDRARFLRGEVDAYTWTEVGSNWVMGELAAAVLVAQLERRAQIQTARLRRWNTYADALREWGAAQEVRLPEVPVADEHTAHIFHLRLRDRASRDAFVAHLRARGVQASFHFQALNCSTAGTALGGRVGQCPVAEDAAETLVRVPLHAGLTDDDQAQVIDAVMSFRR